MAKLLNPAEPVEFSPPDSPVVYTLKVPTPWDRPAFLRALAARGARHWSVWEIIGAIRAALRRLLAAGLVTQAAHDGNAAHLDAYIDCLRALPDALKALDLSDEDGQKAAIHLLHERDDHQAVVDSLATTIAEVDGRLRDMLADNTAYSDYAALEAARRFVLGWTGLVGEFARDAAGLTDAALAAIPADHLIALHRKVTEMFGPTDAEKKTSASPSPSPSSEPPSTAASTPPPTPPSTETPGS